MRLLHSDPSTGLLRLRLETPSDLWRISRLLRPGEAVGGSTTRRDPEAPEGTPAAQRERRRVWIVVRAEEVEFHGFSGRVRVNGTIVEGPFDIGRHHTLDFGEGDEVTVVKPAVSAAERALLDEGLDRRGEPTVLVASVDYGESAIVRIRGRAVERVAELGRGVGGKREPGGQAEKDRAAYLNEIVGLVASEGRSAEAVIVAGPGFLKESVAKRLQEQHDPVAGRLTVLASAESGLAGVDELLRSGRASEVLRASVAAEEAELVERLVTALSGQRAAVGPGEVEEASEAGAVETLLVAEALLTDPRVLRSMELARGSRARLLVVREESPSGKRLAGLGGAGAILRYAWRPSGDGRPTGSPERPRAAPRSDA